LRTAMVLLLGRPAMAMQVSLLMEEEEEAIPPPPQMGLRACFQVLAASHSSVCCRGIAHARGSHMHWEKQILKTHTYWSFFLCVAVA
jgi:hypothetical protein